MSEGIDQRSFPRIEGAAGEISRGDALARSEHLRAALWAYEKDRLPKTAEVVRTNRLGGPERVIDEVEKRAPASFKGVNDVLSFEHRRAIVGGYASMAEFSKVMR